MSCSGVLKRFTSKRQLQKQIDTCKDTIAKLQLENKELLSRIQGHEQRIQELLSTQQKLREQNDKLRVKPIALSRDTGLTIEEIQKIDRFD